MPPTDQAFQAWLITPRLQEQFARHFSIINLFDRHGLSSAKHPYEQSKI
jgi:hypothetical protein